MAGSALIVDDDPGFLGLMARILAGLGVEDVWTAADAAQALATARLARPDVVLVDVGLPDRSGIDLAYELSELPWRPRVVLTSGDHDAALALDAGAGGAGLQFVAKQDLGSDAAQRMLLAP